MSYNLMLWYVAADTSSFWIRIFAIPIVYDVIANFVRLVYGFMHFDDPLQVQRLKI